MSCDKALMALNRIRDRYNTIPAPIYKHADLTVLREDFNRLKEMKDLLRDNAEYHKLISSMGKVLSRMQPSNSEWQNISERSVNKAIRPTSRFNSDQDGKTEWDNRYGHQQAIIPHRSWSAKHFMVLDIVGYSYMLEFGNGNLPKKNLPLFNNANDITLKNDDFVVEISDKQFRKFSSLSIKSKNIYQLLKLNPSHTQKKDTQQTKFVIIRTGHILQRFGKDLNMTKPSILIYLWNQLLNTFRNHRVYIQLNYLQTNISKVILNIGSH